MDAWDRDKELINKLLGDELYRPKGYSVYYSDDLLIRIGGLADPSPGILAALATEVVAARGGDPSYHHEEQGALDTLLCLDIKVGASAGLIATDHNPLDILEDVYLPLVRICPNLAQERLVEIIDRHEWEDRHIFGVLQSLFYRDVSVAREKANQLLARFLDSAAGRSATELLERFSDWPEGSKGIATTPFTDAELQQAESAAALALRAWRERDPKRTTELLNALASLSPAAALAVLSMTLKISPEPVRRLFALEEMAAHDPKLAKLLASKIVDDPDTAVLEKAKALLS